MGVSVVLPVFNGEDFLLDALDSLARQTSSNFELVVVDDGSFDRQFVRKALDRFGFKTLIHQENQGVATALNVGIEACKFDNIAWLSHDDRFPPHRIQVQETLSCAAVRNNYLIFGNYSVFGDSQATVAWEREHAPLELTDPFFGLSRGLINGTATIIPRRGWQQIGGFREDLAHTQDYDFWLRLGIAGWRFQHTAVVLSETRLHANQGSKEISQSRKYEVIDLWRNLLELWRVPEINHSAVTELNIAVKRSPFLGSLGVQSEILSLIASKASLVVPSSE